MATDSIFGDLDVASASDDPFTVKPGVYAAVVSEVKVGETRDKSKVGMTIKYTITEEDSTENGKSVQEWKEIPRKQADGKLDANGERSLSFLKSRLLSLGIPEERMNSVQPDDLQSKTVYITVKKKDDYTNVTKVVLNEGTAAGGFTGF